ncbi:MAG: DUF2752 domain-containing protein [Acidobacteriota bacterium]
MLATGAVLALRWSATADIAAAGPACWIRVASGVPCPGCGMTRAFGRLAAGNLWQAWAFHPLAPIVALEIAIGWLLWGVHLSGRSVSALTGRLEPLLWAHVTVLGALWLGRLATGTLPH